MNITKFTSLIKSKEKEINDLMRRKMPVIAGRIAKDHFQENFRKGGFVNNGVNPWTKSKRISSGSKSASANYGTLLSSRNNLFSSIKYVPGDGSVKISSDISYASAHNFGETIHPRVTPKMKKFAWAKFYQETGIKKGMSKDERKSLEASASAEAKMYKGLALTKKETLTIKIPERKFIGESAELEQAINDKLETELRNILKL